MIFIVAVMHDFAKSFSVKQEINAYFSFFLWSVNCHFLKFHELWKDDFISRETWAIPPFTTPNMKYSKTPRIRT